MRLNNSKPSSANRKLHTDSVSFAEQVQGLWGLVIEGLGFRALYGGQGNDPPMGRLKGLDDMIVQEGRVFKF